MKIWISRHEITDILRQMGGGYPLVSEPFTTRPELPIFCSEMMVLQDRG